MPLRIMTKTFSHFDLDTLQNQPTTYYYTWNVNDTFKYSLYHLEKVERVKADGEELEFLKSYFTNLLFSKSSFQAWYGDTAKSIVYSLMTMPNAEISLPY